MQLTAEDKRKRIKQGYSIGEAAQVLHVPVTTLRDWMIQGKIQGVHLTPGGHRWVERQALIDFAQRKGLLKFTEERRGALRVKILRSRVRIDILSPETGNALGHGSGFVRNISRTGFRVEDLKWKSVLVPSQGATFVFELKSGLVKGAKGIAATAWHLDNRRERGATLGAQIKRFEGGASKEIWLKRAGGSLN